MKHIIELLIFAAFCGWTTGCDRTDTSKPSDRTIKIGIIAPFTGPDSTKGKEGLKGMEMAMQLQPYLRNGNRVTLVMEDDKNDPALTVQSLKKLIERDKVAAVITFSGSGPVLTLASVADDYMTPILAVVATHPDITKENRFVSQLCFDDHVQGTIAALFVRDELLIDRVAVFSNPDSVYSTYLASAFEKKFTAIGGEVTDRMLLTGRQGDLSKTIERLRAKKPELLYLPLRAEDIVRIAEEIGRQRWKPKMMGSDGLMATMLDRHEEALDLVDGMLATDFFADDMPLTAFGKKARGKDNGLRTTYAALGVEGYGLLVDAMNRCSDSQDRDCINNQIRSTTDFIGIAGKIIIKENGKAERPLSIYSIQSGKSHFLVRVY